METLDLTDDERHTLFAALANYSSLLDALAMGEDLDATAAGGVEALSQRVHQLLERLTA